MRIVVAVVVRKAKMRLHLLLKAGVVERLVRRWRALRRHLRSVHGTCLMVMRMMEMRVVKLMGKGVKMLRLLMLLMLNGGWISTRHFASPMNLDGMGVDNGAALRGEDGIGGGGVVDVAHEGVDSVRCSCFRTVWNPHLADGPESRERRTDLFRRRTHR